MLDGWSATTTGSVATNDLKAIVTIYRKDRTHPFVWEANYDECVQKTREGKVTKFWEKSAFMTKKVAISQAFRLCFSDELAGMPYTADEMPEQEHKIEDIAHEVINEEKAKPAITQKMFGQLVERVKAGDTVAIEKAKDKFELSQSQLDTLESIINE